MKTYLSSTTFKYLIAATHCTASIPQTTIAGKIAKDSIEHLGFPLQYTGSMSESFIESATVKHTIKRTTAPSDVTTEPIESSCFLVKYAATEKPIDKIRQTIETSVTTPSVLQYFAA